MSLRSFCHGLISKGESFKFKKSQTVVGESFKKFQTIVAFSTGGVVYSKITPMLGWASEHHSGHGILAF
eukprot:5198522-Amphidinium_carterae.1